MKIQNHSHPRRFPNSFAAYLCLLSLIVTLLPLPVSAGQLPSNRRYTVHDPFTSGNLTIYPITAAEQHDTREFLTLDEGLRNGEVEVTEHAPVRAMVRPRPGSRTPYIAPVNSGGASVNTLMLINHSSRPLLLLAGEIVTGGKQDRVVGKNRIVAPKSDPVDLSVFCVEPGRWTERAANTVSDSTGAVAFGYSGGNFAPMAQPSVRQKAMVAKDQQQVWDSVNAATDTMKKEYAITAGAGASPTTQVEVSGQAGGVVFSGSVNRPTANSSDNNYEVNGNRVDLRKTSSYSMVLSAPGVQVNIDKKAKEIEEAKPAAAPVGAPYGKPVHNESLGRQLRDMNAVGVVVAVNGEIIWADIFADSAMLQKYWPKLVRSYASESMTTRGYRAAPDSASAQRFIDDLEGNHEVVDNEPGVFRHSEVSGRGYKVFALTALLPRTGFDIHVSKVETK